MTNDKAPKSIYSSAADFVETIDLEEGLLPILTKTRTNLTRLQQLASGDFVASQATKLLDALHADCLAAYEVLRFHFERKPHLPMYRSLSEALTRQGMDIVMLHLQQVVSVDECYPEHPHIHNVVTSLVKQSEAEADRDGVLEDNGGLAQQLQSLLSRIPEIWMINAAKDHMESLPVSEDDVTRTGQLIEYYGFSPADVAEALQRKTGIEVQVPTYAALAPVSKLRVVR